MDIYFFLGIWLAFLILPSIILLFLRILLKKIGFSLYHYSFLWFKDFCIAIPISKFMRLVVNAKNIQISIHISSPFIRINVKGVNVLWVNYNLEKSKHFEKDLAKIKSDLKDQIRIFQQKPKNINISQENPLWKYVVKLLSFLAINTQCFASNISFAMVESSNQIINIKNLKQKAKLLCQTSTAKIKCTLNESSDLCFLFNIVSEVEARMKNENSLSHVFGFSLQIIAPLKEEKPLKLIINADRVFLKNSIQTIYNQLVYFIIDFINADTIDSLFKKFLKIYKTKYMNLEIKNTPIWDFVDLQIFFHEVSIITYLDNLLYQSFVTKRDMQAQLTLLLKDFNIGTIQNNPLESKVTISSSEINILDEERIISDIQKFNISLEFSNKLFNRYYYDMFLNFTLEIEDIYFQSNRKMIDFILFIIMEYYDMDSRITIKNLIAQHLKKEVIMAEITSDDTRDEDDTLQANIRVKNIEFEQKLDKGITLIKCSLTNFSFNQFENKKEKYECKINISQLTGLTSIPMINANELIFRIVSDKAIKKYSMNINFSNLIATNYFKDYLLFGQLISEAMVDCEIIYNYAFSKKSISSKKHFKINDFGNPRLSTIKYFKVDGKMLILNILFNDKHSITLFSQDMISQDLDFHVNELVDSITVFWSQFEDTLEKESFINNLSHFNERDFSICDKIVSLEQMMFKMNLYDEKTEVEVKSRDGMLHFPYDKFTFGKTFAKFDYYIRFVYNWIEEYYKNIRKNIVLEKFRIFPQEEVVNSFFKLNLHFENIVMTLAAHPLQKLYAIKNKIFYQSSLNSITSKSIYYKLKQNSKDYYDYFSVRGLNIEVLSPLKNKNRIYETAKQFDESNIIPEIDSYNDFLITSVIVKMIELKFFTIQFENPIMEFEEVEFTYNTIALILSINKYPFLVKNDPEYLYEHFNRVLTYINLPQKYYLETGIKVGRCYINIFGKEGFNDFFDIGEVVNKFLMNPSDECSIHERNGITLCKLDKVRYELHGKGFYLLNNVCINIYPNPKELQDAMNIMIDIFDCKLLFYSFQIQIFNLVMKKIPFSSNETPISKIRLIEIQANLIVNDNKWVHHHFFVGKKSISELNSAAEEFITKRVNFVMKINIPCFQPDIGSPSEVDFSKYALMTNCPCFHFSNSSMVFLKKLLYEIYSPSSKTRNIRDFFSAAKIEIPTLPLNIYIQASLKININELSLALTSNTDSQSFSDILYGVTSSKISNNSILGLFTKLNDINGNCTFILKYSPSKIKYDLENAHFNLKNLIISNIQLDNFSHFLYKEVSHSIIDNQQKLSEFLKLFDLEIDPNLIFLNKVYSIFPESEILNHLKPKTYSSIMETIQNEKESEEYIELGYLKSFLFIPSLTYIQDKEILRRSSLYANSQSIFATESIFAHSIQVKNFKAIYTQGIKEFIQKFIEILLDVFNIRNKKPPPKKWQELIDRKNELKSNNFKTNSPSVSKNSKFSRKPFFKVELLSTQISIQNEVSQAQSLFVSKEIVMEFYKNIDKSGKEIGKLIYEININSPSFEILYAPNHIQSNNQVLWITQNEPHLESDEKIDLFIKIIRVEYSTCLVKYLSITDRSIYAKDPNIDIYLEIGHVKGSFTISNFHEFIDIIRSIMPYRGFKLKEEIECQIKKKEEITKFSKPLKSIVLSKLQERDKEKRDIISETNLQITCRMLELSFNDEGSLLAEVEIEKASSTYIVFSDKSTSTQFDVHKLIIKNCVDDQDYNMCLQPFRRVDNEKFEDTDQMFTVRIQDSFIKGIKDAMWRVFDQIEFIIYPMKICMTQKFLEIILKICIPGKNEEISKQEKVQLLFSQSIPEPAQTIIPEEKEEIIPEQKEVPMPYLFRYIKFETTRILITYNEAQISLKNLQNVLANLTTLTIRNEFITFDNLLELLKDYVISNLFKQIPSLIFQKLFGGESVSELDLKSIKKNENDEEEESLKILFGFDYKRPPSPDKKE